MSKPKCEHAPSEPVAAFCHTCIHCGQPIDAVSCQSCDGTGSIGTSSGGARECTRCLGTGVKNWELLE